MQEIMQSIESEINLLKEGITLTENQFFVILADENIVNHEQDVGITSDLSADIETRRGRVLSKLRGTGTVTKSMMKNVAASFVNGNIQIIEYPSEYCFAVKFTSKTGIPYNITDIQNMIEEIKPAHLAVEYIFTYRLWQDVTQTLQDWEEAGGYTWENLLCFEIRNNLNITDDGVFYCPDENGNAYVVWNNKRAYARREE